MSEQDWRAGLSAGDSVIIAGGYQDDRVASVDYGTPTQIAIGAVRFSRETGRQRGVTSWKRPYIAEPTPDRLTVIAAREAASYLSNVQWFSLPPLIVLDTAQRVKAARENQSAGGSVAPRSR